MCVKRRTSFKRNKHLCLAKCHYIAEALRFCQQLTCTVLRSSSVQSVNTTSIYTMSLDRDEQVHFCVHFVAKSIYFVRTYVLKTLISVCIH